MRLQPLRKRLQLLQQARKIPWEVLERDYLFSWVLAAIGKSELLRNSLVFKGGACLKKCYFGDYRFSEDLDFSCLELNEAVSVSMVTLHSSSSNRPANASRRPAPPSPFASLSPLSLDLTVPLANPTSSLLGHRDLKTIDAILLPRQPGTLLSSEQRQCLRGLLDVPEGSRQSQLELFRRGPTRVSGPALVAALKRLCDIRKLGVAKHYLSKSLGFFGLPSNELPLSESSARVYGFPAFTGYYFHRYPPLEYTS